MQLPDAYKCSGNRGIVPSMDEQSRHFETDQQLDAIDLAMLLGSVANNDRSAFTLVYEATARQLYGIALRVTRQADLAEDALSEAYLQVWRQAQQFDPARGSAMAWLTVICRSRALDLLRKRSTVEIPDLRQDIPDRQGNDTPEPSQLLESVESSSALHQALIQLNEQQRQLLGLAYFKGYSHSELARYTGLPLGTVKTRLRRGVDKLRDLMNGGSHE